MPSLNDNIILSYINTIDFPCGYLFLCRPRAIAGRCRCEFQNSIIS